MIFLVSSGIEEYLATNQNRITHDTYAWYSHFLDLFNVWCAEHHIVYLSQITAAHVQQFVASAPTSNTHTRHARVQVVKGFLSWCAEDEEMGVRERTVKRIEMPKVEQPDVEIFTDVDIMKLFCACDKTRQPKRNDEVLSVRTLQQQLDYLGELAYVEGVHAHRFRHTFAVNQLMHGTSDIVLMRLMGHTTLDATKIYTRIISSIPNQYEQGDATNGTIRN